MRDWLLIISGIFVYTLCMIYSGMLMEKHYIEGIMPQILIKEYVRGAKDGQQFQMFQEQRDMLQGVETSPTIK